MEARSRLAVASLIAAALGAAARTTLRRPAAGRSRSAPTRSARSSTRGSTKSSWKGVAGSRVSRKRLAGFWERFPDEQQRLLDALRKLDPPAGAAAAYLDRLERNIAGYRTVQEALESGSAEPLAARTMNSEQEARRLAAGAGLSRCSPSEHMRPTAYAASLVERAGEDAQTAVGPAAA